MAARLLTRAKAREALGEMPARTFNRLKAEGMPCEGEPPHELFPWPTIHSWYIDRIKRQARGAVRPADFEEARAREMAARAQITELELAKLRGELMTVEQYRAVVGGALTRVRSQLLNLPDRMAPELVGLTTPADAVAKVRGFVDEVMAELRADSHAGGMQETE